MSCNGRRRGWSLWSWEPHQGFINQLPVAKRLSLTGEGPPQQPASPGNGGDTNELERSRCDGRTRPTWDAAARSESQTPSSFQSVSLQ